MTKRRGRISISPARIVRGLVNRASQRNTLTPSPSNRSMESFGAMAAMIFVPYGWAGYGIYEGMQLAIPLTFLKFSRDAEREADFFGIEYIGLKLAGTRNRTGRPSTSTVVAHPPAVARVCCTIATQAALPLG